MVRPVEFIRIVDVLDTRVGWVDLGAVVACIVIAFVLDRGFERRRAASAELVHVPGGIVHVLFPLFALLLIAFATYAYRRAVGPPFFLAIATPLLVALLAIRLTVYGLRRLFPKQSWLPGFELAITLTFWGLALLHFLGVLPEIAEALDDVVISIGSKSVSLLTILKGIAVVLLTLVVTLWISGLIEQRLSRATSIDANLRAVFGRLVRGLLILIGVLIALQAIGFDLTLLAVFGGALGVGIGLGLQKLASSYIAGFTILLDRSVRLGDMVTVDGRTGVVTRVMARYVVVRGLDGIEAIVPNETLVTTTVLNHSYTTRDVRVAVQVQVAYGTDVELALKLLEDIARRTPRVRGEPLAPGAMLTSFGDSGINLELGVWIVDPENGQMNLRSVLNREILAEFTARGIQIPFPQREVRIIGDEATSGERTSEASPPGSKPAAAGTGQTAMPQVGPARPPSAVGTPPA
jgi:small-conductance mechanosensitive channel